MSSEDYFNQVANQWDSMRESFFSEAVRDKALALAGVQTNQLAADIGAGTGFITTGLINKGLCVIAVDQSQAMLTEMESHFPDVNQIDYRVGTAENLPLEEATVDHVFANMYLHHVETPAAAIQEMTRILKSGGKLTITDLDEHHFTFLVEEHHDRWMGFKRADVVRWFTEAGLQHVRVENTGCDCCADSECGTESASISIFIAYGEKV